jgi:hypothetical protein
MGASLGKRQKRVMNGRAEVRETSAMRNSPIRRLAMMLNAGLMAGILAILMFSGAPALAQTPVQGGYGPTTRIPPAPRQQTTSPRRTRTSPARAAKGDLPFTGWDVGGVVLMGAALIGAGLVLRGAILSRRP